MTALLKQKRSRRPSSRRGIAVIIVIAVLAMTMAFAGVWARRIVMERRAARRAEEQQQARWLAEAGVRSLASHPPTLEDLFLRHYGDELADG